MLTLFQKTFFRHVFSQLILLEVDKFKGTLLQTLKIEKTFSPENTHTLTEFPENEIEVVKFQGPLSNHIFPMTWSTL